ncbi:hypothetical protein GCM10010472_19970 [Pseudonocardia halophobica]|uniref:SnoaL-like domain-containing protein n=1 Tax=Pseudonocardia halophobica TaxID=29401 RepID=A0A9W6NTZ3_9PSEU|nr:nuclear transport factor 2 family protein [Pseudonocardia halophobica]GLL09790.1 hypothetical protein GCM10017577_09300 [Pseudonocardia halophobica]
MADHRATITELYRMLDASDRASVGRLFTGEVEFRFGNSQPGRGDEALFAVGRRLRAVAPEVLHDLRTVFVDAEADVAVAEIDMTYRGPDRVLEAPATAVFRFDQAGLITHYHVYLDISPLGLDTSTW